MWRGLFKVAFGRLKAARHSRPRAYPQRCLLLHVLESLLEELHDVLVVQGVVDVLAVAARSHQPHAAEQPELVRHGRLRESHHFSEVAHRYFRIRERVEDAHARRVAQDLEGLGQGGHGRLIEEARLQLLI